MMMTTGFVIGWAKPVPFNPRKLNNVRLDPVKIAMAGPASNILLALLIIFIARILFLVGGGVDQVADDTPLVWIFLLRFVLINFILAIFNLIPRPTPRWPLPC